ncbi:8015_t:CDS:2, partial [Scutellospora calospora]
IADLEISIKSLMTINAELDETNKKQAAEIIELKRMLKIYSTDNDESSTPLTETDLVEIAKDNDVRFKRICLLIDELLRDAQEALECSTKAVGTKVLPNAQLEYKDSGTRLEGLENTTISNTSSKRSKKSKTRNNIDTSTLTNPKLKIKTLMDPKLKIQTVLDPKLKTQHSMGPKLKNSPNTPTSVNSNIKNSSKTESTMNSRTITPSKSLICENGERVREVIEELLVIAKKDCVNNKKTTPKPFERKGLGLLLSIQDGQNGIVPHTTYNSTTNNNVDTSPSSPTISLLYELQELLGIGDAESSKFTNEYRKSCPVISSSRIHFQIDSPNEDGVVDERDSSRAQLNNSTDRARVVRRRSSPNFRTPSSYIMNKSDNIYKAKSNVETNTRPHGSDVVRPSLWASSLGFLTPWNRIE